MPIKIKKKIRFEDVQSEFFTTLNHSYHQTNAYSESSINFRRQSHIDRKCICTNESFTIFVDNIPVIFFSCMRTSENKTIGLNAFGGRPCIAIQNEKLITIKMEKLFVKEVSVLIENTQGTIHHRDFLINGNLSTLSIYLLKMGADSRQIYTQVIDLNKEESEIKRGIRKSYSSLINWGLRELNVKIYTKKDVSWEVVNEYRKLHILESGKETRTEDSWRRQFTMIESGDAFLVTGGLNGSIISAGFFPCSLDSCYYGASASNRDLFDKPIFHALLWVAILHAKSIGCKWFEVGEQLYPSISQPSTKELGISQFKAGFGGTTKAFMDIELSVP